MTSWAGPEVPLPPGAPFMADPGAASFLRLQSPPLAQPSATEASRAEVRLFFIPLQQASGPGNPQSGVCAHARTHARRDKGPGVDRLVSQSINPPWKILEGSSQDAGGACSERLHDTRRPEWDDLDPKARQAQPRASGERAPRVEGTATPPGNLPQGPPALPAGVNLFDTCLIA